VKPFYKSENAPEKSFDDGVYKLVGKNFKSFVDTTKDPVVIFFYKTNFLKSVQFLKDFKAVSRELSSKFPKVKFAAICTH